MKISYINGVCVKNDAVSNAIRDEITWLSNEGGNDVHLYAYTCDCEDLPFTKVNQLHDIAFDQHFQSSGLVVFHFGIFSPLFNLLPVVPKRAKRLVVFHNITPKLFLPVEYHPTIDKSFQQMSNIVYADHVVCDSQTNLDVLRLAGIKTPATVLPLAVHSDLQMPESKPSFKDGLIRLAFVGRFVKSKGPGELLEALQLLLQRSQTVRLTLCMIGNLSFSDSLLYEEITKTVEAINNSFGKRTKVSIHGNAADSEKFQILRDADLFVLPTYHEGFCVPILEALACGCRVITYDNSNTPSISGGFARLSPTGNIEKLSRAILEEINEITSSAWKKSGTGGYSNHARKAGLYVQHYSPENVKRIFLHFMKYFTRNNVFNAARFDEWLKMNICRM